MSCGSHEGRYCIPAPIEDEYCDPEAEISCSCAENLVCRAEGKEKVKDKELKKYLEYVCKYYKYMDEDKKGRKCPDRKKLKRKDDKEDYFFCSPGQQGLPPQTLNLVSL